MSSAAELSPFWRCFIVLSMLLTGTAVTIASKCQLESHAVGSFVEDQHAGGEPRAFAFPWFLVFTMFIGEAMCLPLFFLPNHVRFA